MPRIAIPKPDNPEQYKRFLETAREAGADEPGARRLTGCSIK